MRWLTILVGAVLLLGRAFGEEGGWELDDTEAPTLRVLDDSSFEHDTQASTGQTSGSWLVLFKNSDCVRCSDVESILLRLLSQSHEGLPILSTVNIGQSPKTGKRFKVANVPELKLFRNRHMFSYGGQLSSDSILAFLQDGWTSAPYEEVPEEPTLMSEITEKLSMIYHSIVEYLGNRPGILAAIGSISATGAYLITKKFLIKKQKQRRPRSRLRKRAK